MIKQLFTICTFLITISASAQNIIEKEVKTEVKEVTVFLEGAQVIRKSNLQLSKGVYLLKFSQLSPFIDAKSIQVKSSAGLTVIAVNHQFNFLEKSEKSVEQGRIQNEIEALDDQIVLENTHLVVVKDELSFLQENKVVGGKNEQLNLTAFVQTYEFFSKKNSELKLKEIEINKKIYELNKQKADLEDQFKQISGKQEFPSGEILVKLEVMQAQSFDMEISYLVSNAAWYPSYDIRAKSINEPISLMYNANVRQDTKEDWKNVKIRLSSASPNISGVAPVLQTYLLNYHSQAPKYAAVNQAVKGMVVDAYGEPLPGVSVLVKGTTIGTITDLNGQYSITIPSYATDLVYSFVGFYQQTLPISNTTMNVVMAEEEIDLEEVVVMGYSKAKPLAKLQGKVAGVNVAEKELKIRGLTSLPVQTIQQVNQTSVDFEIAMPYTVLSDNKNYSVDIEKMELPADFQYFAVPKADKDAFLIARISDWEKYSLLEGEANVFFEETYIGKTLLDVKYATDTLQISLGRDKQVSIKREKIKEYTNRQFIGNKKEESIAWKTTVKNNKQQTILILIADQVPVSTLQEIEVSILNLSGGKLNSETGEVNWTLEIKPGESKELQLSYSVKYPKSRVLVIE